MTSIVDHISRVDRQRSVEAIEFDPYFFLKHQGRIFRFWEEYLISVIGFSDELVHCLIALDLGFYVLELYFSIAKDDLQDLFIIALSSIEEDFDILDWRIQFFIGIVE